MQQGDIKYWCKWRRGNDIICWLMAVDVMALVAGWLMFM
jgi:hypothetical protein